MTKIVIFKDIFRTDEIQGQFKEFKDSWTPCIAMYNSYLSTKIQVI